MKLTVFDSESMPRQLGRNQSQPSITFGKGGNICFNKAAVDLIELEPGSQVSFAQDKDDPACWYLFIDPKKGFPMRSKDKNGCMMFNHQAFRLSLLNCFGLDTSETHRFMIAGVPTKINDILYFGILTGADVIDNEELS